MKLARLLADLGSNKNGLGGGAAAALAGASGAALLEMVARLNDKRLKGSSGTATKAAALSKRFQNLIVEDAKAFGLIQRAYKAREKKPAAWQEALKNGVKPPVRMAQSAYQGWLLLKNERPRTSEWLKGDLMEVFLLLDVVYGGALLNAEVNLKGIKDEAFKARIEKELKKSAVHRELWK